MVRHTHEYLIDVESGTMIFKLSVQSTGKDDIDFATKHAAPAQLTHRVPETDAARLTINALSASRSSIS